VSAPRLDLILLWHMHQPDYRDADGGAFLLPWVYLHALKDYTDMAAHLERHPAVHAVVNFVPVLVEQIEDYVRQFDEGRIRDPLLGLLQQADLDRIEPHERALILDSCFHNNHDTMLSPYPQYRRLHEVFSLLDRGGGERFAYLSGAYLSDLLTWYHLVWIGETERRADPLFARLMAKGEGFTHGDRLLLFEAIGAILRRVLGRYRALAARGQIELSTTPHTHPIAPLLIDFATARETVPAAPLPAAPGYPGGAERVRVHLQAAIDAHTRCFGAPPAGLWPAEGAVSTAFLREVAAGGLRWMASSETVLSNSLNAHAPEARVGGWLHRAWRVDAAPEVTLLFRDERLSDQIGFEYSKWHGRDAALHLVGELEKIAASAAPGTTPTVLIALDGENAWEYYPYNGFYFFEELYGALAAHPTIRTHTVSGWLDRQAAASSAAQTDHQADAQPGAPAGSPGRLPALVAGSWVLGTLSTWIGEAGKNRAWDLLCAAKQTYDEVMASGRLTSSAAAAARRQLATCEGSDWFWWMGPYNPDHAVERFDRLFRRNLRRLYELLGAAAPAGLDLPISAGTGHPEAGGAMRRASA